jgi:Undecaprenyl-phosphate galactose phosphotransferase WbaP
MDPSLAANRAAARPQERRVSARSSVRSRWASVGRSLLPMAFDLAILLLAGLVAVLLWASPVRDQGVEHYLPAAPLLALVVLGYAQAGLYPGFGLGPVETLRRYSLVTVAAFVVMASLVFVLKLEDSYSRITLALACAASLLLVPLGRAVLARVAQRWSWWREPVVLVGHGGATASAWSLFRDRASTEFRPVGILAAHGDPPPTTSSDATHGDLPMLGSIEDAREVARAGVQIAFADLDGPQASRDLDFLRLVFPRVIMLRGYEDLPVAGVQVRNLDGALGLEYGSNLLRRQARWVKRATDIALGGMGLLLALPIIGAAALAVKIASPGPAFFRQVREGRKGRSIRVPKIRTMVPDAEGRMAEILVSEPGVREEWEAGFKLHEDPRIIPGVGAFLRRFSIDELPQLWSVVRGDMSLVGPRPFPFYHLEALSPQSRRLRNQVRPGITGLWQVSARGVADVDAQERYDVHYIRNWSIWLDLHILARTVRAVLSGRGAY